MTDSRLQKRLPRSPRDNRDYNLGEKMKRGLAIPDFKDWGFPQEPLDQAETAHCGGFSIANKRISAGSLLGSVSQSDADGHAYYYGIKKLEGKPTDEDGVFTRDAFKFMAQQGFISAYAFAENLSVAREFVLTQDTLLFGSVWLDGMFTPDKDGYVHAVGPVAGGHLWEIRGYDSINKRWIGQNSWGNFGLNGKFYISDADFELLYRQAGEIGAAVEKPSIAPSPDTGCMDWFIPRNVQKAIWK
jgi:hypothetical protein